MSELRKNENDMGKYFAYLEALRESGKTNMLGAIPYLQRDFPELSHYRARAHEILTAWMYSLSEAD